MTKNDSSVVSSKPISFSFAGCGFLGLYHVGVASCLREYAPINRNTKIAGASAGALAAMALACDLPLGESTSEILSVAIKARSRALGPFHPSFDVNRIIYESLVKTLPDDAHLKANGRLSISVTRISDGKNVIINKFKSKEELIKAIQCSCFIPLWSGLVPPKFNGISYIDGGCSDNLPIIDENTVTVSPFSGESDICPQDDTYNLFQLNLVNTSIALTPANFYRITRILFPAHPEVLSKMCQQGFDDALRYLQRNNKISCTRCLAIHFTLEKEDTNKENEEISLFEQKVLKKIEKHIHSDKNNSHENCRDCEYRRQIAGFDSLPESVVQAIQEACDQVNKGIINWLFRHKPMKLLSILSIPYLLPIDITIVLFSKVYERLPDIKRELRNSLIRLVSFLRSLLVKMETNRYFYSAKFSCQLDLKEFNYAKEEPLKTTTRKISSTSSTLSRKKSSVHAAVAASATATSVTSPVRPKPSKVEKSNSFSGRKNSEYRSVFSGDMKKSMESVVIPSNVDQLLPQQQQSLPLKPKSERLRKTSYAGREFGYGNYSSPNTSPSSSFNSGRGVSAGRHQYARRQSMIEIDSKGVYPQQQQQRPLHPERVISQLNFDFKLDMKNSKSDKSISNSDISRHHSIDSVDGIRQLANSLEASLNSLSEKGVDGGSNKVLDIDLTDIDQNNAIEIANKALDWEKELIDKCRHEDTDGEFEQIFEITRNQDAALAYYYTDPVTDKVKFTELFNITNIDLKDMGDDTDAEDYDVLDDEHDEQCTAAGDVYTDDADDEYDDEFADEHQKTLLPADHQRYQQPQMETYNDSDDGLIETTPPATVHSNSLKSSLSSLHSAPPSPSLNESKSPSKRMRKKSVLVD